MFYRGSRKGIHEWPQQCPHQKTMGVLSCREALAGSSTSSSGKWDLCQCLLARVAKAAQPPVGECQHFWPHYPVVTSTLTHSIPRGEASSSGEERGIGITAALRLCSKRRRALPFPGHVASPALCFSLLSSVRNRIASYFKQRLLCWGKNEVVVKF